MESMQRLTDAQRVELKLSQGFNLSCDGPDELHATMNHVVELEADVMAEWGEILNAHYADLQHHFHDEHAGLLSLLIQLKNWNLIRSPVFAPRLTFLQHKQFSFDFHKLIIVILFAEGGMYDNSRQFIIDAFALLEYLIYRDDVAFE